MSGAAESRSGFISRWWRVIALIAGVLIAFFVGFVPHYVRASHLKASRPLFGRSGNIWWKGKASTVAWRNQSSLRAGYPKQLWMGFPRRFRVFQQRAQPDGPNSDTNLRNALKKIVVRRGAVIAGLSKADPGVRTPIG